MITVSEEAYNEGLAAQIKLAKICTIYNKYLKPFLGIIRTLLFWKPLAKAGISIFTATMSEICPPDNS